MRTLDAITLGGLGVCGFLALPLCCLFVGLGLLLGFLLLFRLLGFLALDPAPCVLPL